MPDDRSSESIRQRWRRVESSLRASSIFATHRPAWIPFRAQAMKSDEASATAAITDVYAFDTDLDLGGSPDEPRRQILQFT